MGCFVAGPCGKRLHWGRTTSIRSSASSWTSRGATADGQGPESRQGSCSFQSASGALRQAPRSAPERSWKRPRLICSTGQKPRCRTPGLSPEKHSPAATGLFPSSTHPHRLERLRRKPGPRRSGFEEMQTANSSARPSCWSPRCSVSPSGRRFARVSSALSDRARLAERFSAQERADELLAQAQLLDPRATTLLRARCACPAANHGQAARGSRFGGAVRR